MSFTDQDISLNFAAVNDLVRDNFNDIENKEELKDHLAEFVNQQKISLFTYSGEAHRALLINAIKKTIKERRFQPNMSQAELVLFNTQLVELNKSEMDRYLQQAPEVPGVIRQLAEKGYVAPKHILTHVDIQQALGQYLDSKLFVDPISINDNLEVLKVNLRLNNSPVLYIPANLNHNHWIWLKLERDEQNNRTHFTCWDPVKGTETQIHSSLSGLLNNVTLAVTQIYGDQIDIKYEFGNEQKDGFTCGYRVIQKILKDKGINNAFTQVPVDDPNKLYVEFIKMLASGDNNLKNVIDDLTVITEDNTVTVYRGDVGFAQHAEVKNIIKNRRSFQEQADKFLAIVLQDVYFSNADITSDDAMNKAMESMNKLKMSDIQQKEKELIQQLEKKEKEFSPKVAAKNMQFFKIKNAQASASSEFTNCSLESEDSSIHKNLSNSNIASV